MNKKPSTNPIGEIITRQAFVLAHLRDLLYGNRPTPLLTVAEADVISCTGGRTDHEWYLGSDMTLQQCRQCGVKATRS